MKVHSDKRQRTVVLEDKFSEEELSQAIMHLTSVLCDVRRKSGDPKIDIRQFTVNWNDTDQMRKLSQQTMQRFKDLTKGESNSERPSRTNYFRTKWDAIQNILNTDIDFLYDESKFDTAKKYYVYAHCDTTLSLTAKTKDAIRIFAASYGLTSMPFYIGKGTGDRYLKGNRNRNHLKIAQKDHNDVEKKILVDNLTELAALQLESKLIDIFGLKIHSKGYLINIDEGVERDDRRFTYREELNKLRSIENIL